MTATVGVWALLASPAIPSQRGGAETKPPATARDLSGRTRQVTAGYLRMTDPGFVARTLELSGTTRGRIVAAGVLDPETLAQRGPILAAYAPYLRGVERTPMSIGGGGSGNGGRPKPFDPNAPKESAPAPSGPIKIVYSDTTAAVDLGTAVQDDKGVGFVTAMYRGVAPKDGTLTIAETPYSALDATKVILYTGEVKDGVPQTTSTMTGNQVGKSFAVKKGQEFAVRVRLAVQKTGAFSEPIVVNDGTRKITISARGKVVPKSGQLSCWIEESDLYVLPGTPTNGVLHVRLDGNAPSAIAVTGSANFSGAVVSVKGGQAKAKEEITIPFRIGTPDAAPNGSGTVTFQVKAYDGKAAATAQASGKAETVWTEWKDFLAAAGNVTATGTFRYSTAGDWDFMLLAKTTSKNVNDFVGCAVAIDTPTNAGFRLYSLVGGELAAKSNSGPSSRLFNANGWDIGLVGPAFINSHLIGKFMVEGSGQPGPLKPVLDYWVQSNKLKRLSEK